MVKVIAPDDMNRPTISDGSRNPASISPSVVSGLGSSQRAVANSLGNLVGAFGDAMGRVASAKAASSEADARLEWLKGDYEIRSDLAANAGEDGELYRTAPDRYGGLNKSIDEKYGNLGEKFQRWRDEQTWRRGTEAGNNYLKGQRTVFTRGWDQDSARLAERVQKGEIDPTEFNEMYRAQVDKLSALDSKVIPKSEAQARARQLQAQLALSVDSYLKQSSPDKRAKFWGDVAKGQFALESGQVGGGSGSSDLGSVSAKYESGGRGVGFVSTGYKDPGGVSYGIHQLSGAYSMGAFLRSPEGKAYADAFDGMKPGTSGFTKAYKAIAAKDPNGFAKAQKAFYTRTHYKPVMEHAKGLGYDVANRGVQEALFSMGVQHGGARKIVSNAGKAQSTPADQIKALYAARTKYVQGLSSLPAETKRSVLNRYTREVNDALALADAPGITMSGGDSSDMPAQPKGHVGDEVEGDPTAQPGTYSTANDNAAWDGSIPEGRLVEGQTFTVETERGTIEIPAEWINAIPAKARAAYGKDASEALKIAQRQRKVLADSMMENAEAHMAEYGTLPPRYSAEQVKDAYRDNPDKIRKHVDAMRYGQGIANAKAKAADAPTPDITRMIDEMRPRQGSENFAVRMKIYEGAAKDLQEITRLRQADPAKAVEGSREVASVLSKIPGGVPRSTNERIALAQARLEAQTRLEIEKPLRSPVTMDEARGMAGGLSALSEDQALTQLERIHAKAKERYGIDLADDVTRAAVRSVIKDAKMRSTFVAQIQSIHDAATAPPEVKTEVEETETGSWLDYIPDMDQWYANWNEGYQIRAKAQNEAMGRDQPDSGTEPAKPKPKPSREAIEYLRKNPFTWGDFESTFGVDAEQYYPGIKAIVQAEGGMPASRPPDNPSGIGQSDLQSIMRQ